MKRTSLVILSLLLLALLVASIAYSQTNRRERMKPLTDGVSHSSGENGKWVKGCSTGQACNMGVGNLGPAGTYHWE